MCGPGKLEAYLPAVLECALQEDAASTNISAQLRRQIGFGWTLMTSPQAGYWRPVVAPISAALVGGRICSVVP